LNPHLAQFALAGILDANPWLAEFDCRSCPAIEAADFHAAYSWLVNLPEPPDPKRSCYNLKHEAERVRKDHISERAFIAGAIAAGYGIKIKGRSAFLSVNPGPVRSS
jgi:hypothetical protein